ncbi:MAG TPA: HPF/RaiA family ribosome-associated protein [Bdellovibrionales bacterium]|nr:HPF/RaiA family ribosome-associated protein [Bdellovibrionales bacterium]
MKIETTFRHLTANEDSRDFVRDLARGTLGEFEGAHELEVFVVAEHSGPEFECKLLLRASWLGGDLYARETHPLFYGAVHEALHVAKMQIAKRMKKKTAHRRLRGLRAKYEGHDGKAAV